MGQVDKQADQIRLRTHERPLPGELILLENQDRSLWNREQIAEGLELVENALGSLLEQGELANYYLAHSARAELCRRLSRTAEARSSYEKALALTQQEPERQFLQERIQQLT